MALDMAITYKDLGLIAIFVVAVVAGFFLIRALASARSVLLALAKLLRDNEKALDKTIKELPAMAENMSKLSGHTVKIAESLRAEQKKIDETLAEASKAAALFSETARELHDDVFSGIRGAIKLISALVGFFSGKGRQPSDGEDGDADGGGDDGYEEGYGGDTGGAHADRELAREPGRGREDRHGAKD